MIFRNYVLDDNMNYQFNQRNTKRGDTKYGFIKYRIRYDGACKHHAGYHYYNLEFMDMFQRKYNIDMIKEINVKKKTYQKADVI